MPDTFTTQSIHEAFQNGDGARVARDVLALTLRGFTGVEMFERSEMLAVEKIFETSSLNGARERIHHYRLKYLGQSVSVIAFRDDQHGIAEPASLAYFNDTNGTYQPIDIDQLIRFIQDPPAHLSKFATLEDIAIRANEARVRVLIAGPSAS
jgi:hypothetical protein